MTQEAASFFTLDRGTVSTSVALIAPVDGRYRLLAADSAPRELDVEALLEDLVRRVTATEPSLLDRADAWPAWSRLEVGSGPAPRVCLVAASPDSGEPLERAFTGAGWDVVARFFEPRPDPVALGEACLDGRCTALAVGLREPAPDEEREQVRRLWPLAGSLGRFRDDLALIACGPLTERPEGIPDERLFSLPAPEPLPATAESRLRRAAGQVGAHLAAPGARPAIDARVSLRAAIASLAVLLEGRVEGIEVGAAAGSRTLAHPEGELRHAVLATGALLPAWILEPDGPAEAILRWSTNAGDPASDLDRLRTLRLQPWSGIEPQNVRLRAAALRAALERMQEAWDASPREGRADEDAADVVVLGGGAFAGLPAAAVALALVDGVRRPGAGTILHDHAGVLAPLGALPVEGDRRRLLADLMDDVLLPIGSSLVTGSLGRHGTGARVSVSTVLGADELPLEPERLELVDLPPGIVARLDIDPHEATVLGVQGQRLTLEVSGGLAGLLVDTRAIPLQLPENAEQRRSLIEAWERPAWTDGDR